MRRYTTLAYANADDMVFGRALYPVKCGFDLEIGANYVVPELKYAPRPGKEESLPTILDEYRRITRDALERAVGIGLPAVVLELEHVFQLTFNPEWGSEVTRMTKDMLGEYHSKYGLRSALRATIADIRKAEEGMRSSDRLQRIVDSFEACAAAGADILSIESIGGKEVFNYCVTRQDVAGAIFSVGVLGSLDMEFLWQKISSVAERHHIIAGGDTDCAHSNTAMFLAGGLLSNEMPHTFAALVRALGAARSLVAFENGAVGPAKDCGYENVILKAITGCPMSMEGKTSACAHSDLMGNLVMATCDLWSNEAVQYGDMFGGTTPQVFMEMLGYDVAQMNTALQLGSEKILRDIFVQSDKYRDPQALVLAPEEAFSIGEAIVSGTDYYDRSVRAVMKAGEIISQANEKRLLPLTRLENDVLQRMMGVVSTLPKSSEKFVEWGIQEYSKVVPEFRKENYGL